MRRFQHLMIALVLFSTTSCVHVGQRLLTIQIEVDGQVVLEGIRGVPDNTPVNEMWDVLGDVSFMSMSAEHEHPDTLNGNVVVRIKHVDRQLTSAKLKTLSLQPDDAGSEWSIGKDEAERIKQAASD